MKEAEERLEALSLILAIECASRANMIRRLLWQAYDLCDRAGDPALRALGDDIRKLSCKVPEDDARLARALGVEPEEFEFYSQKDHERDLSAYREARGLPVPDTDYTPLPFEHPADLLASLRKRDTE